MKYDVLWFYQFFVVEFGKPSTMKNERQQV